MVLARDKQPLIDNNPQLQSYYDSLETRLGFRLVLGGARHFGYYAHDTYWPFPFDRALRAMEDQLAELLGLQRGSQILDAGCGDGLVAIRLASKHGYKVQAIDVVDSHVVNSRHNVARAGLSENDVTVHKMDYHHLDDFKDGIFDGAYTMETFVHATDPRAVLRNFFRVLRPGGRLALFEYDNALEHGPEKELALTMRKINEFSAMPTNALSEPGVLKQLLEETGFVDVVVRDYSRHIVPMTRIFYLLAYVPFIFITLFGLERYFINTVAGVECYRGRDHWRYVAISASKPDVVHKVKKRA